MGRLVWDRPSVTIRTEFFKPEKGRYLHPTEHRAIKGLCKNDLAKTGVGWLVTQASSRLGDVPLH